jgi:hypothetical protein
VSEQDEAQPAASGPERRIHCAGCGYDLRGLLGDPVRCPECGALAGRSAATAQKLQAGAARFVARRKRLEVGPNLCAIAIGAATFFSGLFMAFPGFFEPIRRPPYVTCLIIWIAGFSLFTIQCRRAPRWYRAFLSHQIYGVLAALGNALLILGAFVGGVVFLAATESLPGFVMLALAAAVACVLLIRPMRWFSRRASRELDGLVRASLDKDDARAEP